MKGNKYIHIMGAALAMLAVILDSRTALTGALQGVNLCIYTVIPSLFPLFVLSHYLTHALCGTPIRFMRSTAKLCGVPKGGESLLLVGLIGGYPVGAQSIRKLYESGKLNKADSHRLLGFCSNAGPAFIFGMSGSLFQSMLVPWLLWVIQIISAILTGILLPGKRSYSISREQEENISFIGSMRQSIHALANVCGWVILFRILSFMLTKWFLWYLPIEMQVVINGTIELVNGCNALRMLRCESIQMILCSVFLSAGGLCVCMQTMSVIGNLDIRPYLKGKLLQSVISGILASIVACVLFHGNKWVIPIMVLIFACVVCCMVFFKKRVAFSGEMIYNTKKSL